jgi:hypothetical protein
MGIRRRKNAVLYQEALCTSGDVTPVNLCCLTANYSDFDRAMQTLSHSGFPSFKYAMFSDRAFQGFHLLVS